MKGFRDFGDFWIRPPLEGSGELVHMLRDQDLIRVNDVLNFSGKLSFAQKLEYVDGLRVASSAFGALSPKPQTLNPKL